MEIRDHQFKEKLTEEQVRLYPTFIPWIKIYQVTQHSFDFTEKRPEKLIFAVNFGGRFCIWQFGLEIRDLEKKDFGWWTGNTSGRILNGTDDDILSAAIALCLRENIEDIYWAGKHFELGKEWTLPIGRAIEYAKELKWL